MLDAIPKALFHLLASSATVKRLASRYGLRHPNSFARRFIAGETSAEAIDAARALEARHFVVSLDLLGESVATMAEADAATRGYLAVMEDAAAAGVGRNVSLKLTQLGLDVDRATAIDNLRRILDVAEKHDFFVRIDMESSLYTEATLDIFETVWNLGQRHVGVVLQSALRRSEDDLRRVNRLGARVRLVKGAYKEPRQAAYQSKGRRRRRVSAVDAGAAARRGLPGAGDPRSGDDRRGAGPRRRAGSRAGSLRVPDALRRAPRPPGAARRGRLPRPCLYSLRS